MRQAVSVMSVVMLPLLCIYKTLTCNLCAINVTVQTVRCDKLLFCYQLYYYYYY